MVMVYKLFLSLLLILMQALVFAVKNDLLQKFDNQVSIGFGMNQAFSTFGTNPRVPKNMAIVSQSNLLNLEIEKLLNNGIWIDVNANMAFGAGPVGRSFNLSAPDNTARYQNVSDYGINAKVGFAFPLVNQHLQLTPYALFGLNNLTSTSLMLPEIAANSQIANVFSYTSGAGGRMEYRINNAILLFADQFISYNWDNSGPQFGIQPQNTVIFTSTLGAKFNLVKNLQLGAKGFYSNYQPQAGNSVVTPFPKGSGFIPQLQNSFGGLLSIGLTY